MPGQVKVIIPPKFQAQMVEKILRTEMEKYAPFFVKDFEKTTSMWKGKKPTFKAHIKVGNDALSVEIHVVGNQEGREKWHYLNEGTKPHKIKAKRAKYLRFRLGYQAGSKPNSAHTIPARKGEGAFVQKKEVNHPGFAARNFSALIAKENQRPFERWMDSAMREAARASGHGRK